MARFTYLKQLFQPNRLVGEEDLEAIILVKSKIIDRMSQIDPHPFWNEQRADLIANAILNRNGAELDLTTLNNKLHEFNLPEAQFRNKLFFKSLIRTRENFRFYGRFD